MTIWNNTRFAIEDTFILECGGDTFGYTVEERIKILEKGAKVLEFLTDDGDTHIFASRIALSYRGMAILAASIGQNDRALDYLERCAFFLEQQQKLAKAPHSSKHTSVLTRTTRMEYHIENAIGADTFNVMTDTGEHKRSEFDELRHDPRFIAVAERIRDI